MAGYEDRGRSGRGLLERLREGLGRLARGTHASGKTDDTRVPAGTGTTGTGVTMSGHQAGTKVPQQDEPPRRG